jgi:hypothetical protein
MGTRADFYVGRGEAAEWLGSIGWDGYPDGIDDAVKSATTLEEFQSALQHFVASREDWTKPDDGWPWPWDNSRTTDYAYAFDGGKVWASCFGHEWFDATQKEPDGNDAGRKTAVFPDMSGRKNVTLGRRSGVIVIRG